MFRAVVLAGLVIAGLAAGCGKGSSNKKPTGTLSDPVEVCERVADVCRLDRSRLGVCTTGKTGTDLVCASQH